MYLKPTSLDRTRKTPRRWMAVRLCENYLPDGKVFVQQFP